MSRCQCYGVDCGGSIYDPAHPCMEFGPEIGSEAWVKAQIARKLVPQERDRMCDGRDGPLPCSKPAGHDGPHYFYMP